MRRRKLGNAALSIGGDVLLMAGSSACGIRVRNSEPVSATVVPDEYVPRLDVETAFAEVRSGTAVLVDVRSVESWRSRRAAGALSLPLDDIEHGPAAAAATLARGRRPILYCT